MRPRYFKERKEKMPAKLINGAEIAGEIRAELKEEVQ
jgi:hypothetical protein